MAHALGLRIRQRAHPGVGQCATRNPLYIGRVAERGRVVRRCLAMRARRAGLLGGARRKLHHLHHRCCVGGAHRVMHQAGQRRTLGILILGLSLADDAQYYSATGFAYAARRA